MNKAWLLINSTVMAAMLVVKPCWVQGDINAPCIGQFGSLPSSPCVRVVLIKSFTIAAVCDQSPG